MSARVRRVLLLVLGSLMFAVGALWTFQGLGYIDDTSMSDVEVFAVVGPLVAGLGVAFAMVAFRRAD